MSPVELLFGRKMHIIVPELANIYADQEVRDQDNEQKAKYRLYTHLHRGAKPWINTTRRSNTPKEREEGQAYKLHSVRYPTLL